MLARMSGSPELQTFVERAKAGGISDAALVGTLTARGWPEKDVYQVLAAHYEKLLEIEIPSHHSTGTAAKDAFFYLLTFSALATWTIAVGSLGFTLIEQWFTDTLFSAGNQGGYDVYEASWNIAAILVAFPFFLLLSRSIVRDLREHPEKLNSPVRKWLTYIALVIAACVLIGDLITTVTYFLRGEITTRFILKTLLVLLLSGGVFTYYFGGLREAVPEVPKVGITRDRWLAVAAAIFLAVMVALGLGFTGAPRTQRSERADSKRVQDLFELSQQISARWNSGNRQLPEHLDELRGSASADPVTRASYDYRPKSGSQYQLCATFELPSRQSDLSSTWSHTAGNYCFTLDASQPPAQPSFRYSPFGY